MSGTRFLQRLALQIMFNGVMRSYHEKAGSSFTELKEISVENLPGELAKFLMVVRKQDGSCYNASSLNTYYQSLARFIASEQYNSPLDIKTDVRFKKVREVLKLKCTESAMDVVGLSNVGCHL